MQKQSERERKTEPERKRERAMSLTEECSHLCLRTNIHMRAVRVCTCVFVANKELTKDDNRIGGYTAKVQFHFFETLQRNKKQLFFFFYLDSVQKSDSLRRDSLSDHNFELP